MESGTLVPAVSLDGYQAASLMSQLSARGTPLAEVLWKRVHYAWLFRGASRTVVVPLSARELQLVRRLGASNRLPGVVDYQFLAIYRHPDFPQQEVRLRTVEVPPKRRTFRVQGHGRQKFTRRKLYRIIQRKPLKESEQHMAKAKTKSKKKQNTKDVEDDDEDELEGLEELEDLEDEDVEEPDAEEDDDEDEEPAPKKKSKKSKKTKTAPKATKKTKRAKKVVEEDEDEDEDDDEEEEDEPVVKKSKKKSKSKKTEPKAKSKGTSAAGRTTAEATGGVGTAELAEAASEIAETEIEGRDVRVYLRKNQIPKDEEHGRYVWKSVNNKEFKKLAKAIAAEFEE